MDGNSRPFPKPGGFPTGTASRPNLGGSRANNYDDRKADRRDDRARESKELDIAHRARLQGLATIPLHPDARGGMAALHVSSSSSSSTTMTTDVPGQLLDALQRFGPAPGAKVMLQNEKRAAEEAIANDLYVTWRSTQGRLRGQDCTRVGPNSACFCGHAYREHEENISRYSFKCLSAGCNCVQYNYIPTRPEECGEYWLVRRKDFDVRTYKAKCKCKHSHLEHDAKSKQCRARGCSCFAFTSAFLCVACDEHSETHETVWARGAERRAQDRDVGDDYLPLNSMPQVAKLVFNPSQPPQIQRQQQHQRLGHSLALLPGASTISNAGPRAGLVIDSAATPYRLHEERETRSSKVGSGNNDDDEDTTGYSSTTISSSFALSPSFAPSSESSSSSSPSLSHVPLRSASVAPPPRPGRGSAAAPAAHGGSRAAPTTTTLPSRTATGTTSSATRSIASSTNTTNSTRNITSRSSSSSSSSSGGIGSSSRGLSSKGRGVPASGLRGPGKPG